ncbi:lipopolysaccharide/colanic/teichoic acid biosynthesis glycosyltransferase [Paenibacillus endophyticus]|uniref:Lipopolysaccharide/colanic/teichoic acid biosynthesis glycosyltransferase n=1 Tax=Paenibacillus endophyticus TaxID=1294268 RepID=A0A7W5CCH3_9BACL|nr:sugar transferase [Paenibacillus endophyticus]MBB3155191.1 lipopolysaccharide/colanic/teichoic acid biosynthesis glycosyltransferase [Paenibacillus endophyticus]
MTPPQYQDEAVVGVTDYYANAVSRQGDGQTITMYAVMKRTIDIVGSFFGLLLLSPLFVIIAILIKWEDPKGSVFFYQTRIGKDEKPFRMYKFRSMLTGAEDKLKELLDKNEISGAMFKMKDDPRITKIGKLIRKTSIDELPQLLNVLRGEMSLVGPRPPLTREVAEYTEYDKQRLSVTPGCTGLWQVSGRNNLCFKQMVELDLAYIEKRCIWFDIKIMFRTVRAVVGSQDAY